ncbi:MAG: hypothetical protein GXY76_14980 [Chloroflexi bacterium]|nr:hypothetical protein [Chloroflexota bacterium]
MNQPIRPDMPQVPFGPYTISRLILGSNPCNAISHLSRFLDNQMRRYFTQERILELLWRAQGLGINTWQATAVNLDVLRAFREQGGKMQFISLAQETDKDPHLVRRLADAGAIAIAHHGGVTDSLWKQGRINEVREFCKKVRDSGAMVGVSMHMPVVLDHVLDEGWDVDFFMCCLYQVTRSEQDIKTIMPNPPEPPKKVFLAGDPARMLAAIRRSDKPCLAFKLLAAGRLCEDQVQVEQAFASTLGQIKATDAVIVGMYPEYEDQAALNAAYVRKYG